MIVEVCLSQYYVSEGLTLMLPAKYIFIMQYVKKKLPRISLTLDTGLKVVVAFATNS